MEKTLMEIIDKLMKIEDDEQFCIAEYDAVQDYCYKKDFQLSKEERQIIRDIGLEESFFSWIGNIRKRLEKYEETGNTEFLADIANFAMIEFMCPSIPGAHYEKTDSGACETVGFGILELKNK